MTIQSYSPHCRRIGKMVFWTGAAVTLTALVQRTLPTRALQALPWKALHSPGLGMRIVRRSFPTALIGLVFAWAHNRKIQHPAKITPKKEPKLFKNNDTFKKEQKKKLPSKYILRDFYLTCPEEAGTAPLPSWSAMATALAPSQFAGVKRYFEGRRFWKEWQCEVAMDQYTHNLFKKIAGWKTTGQARHLSEENERLLFNEENKSFISSISSWWSGKQKNQEVQTQKKEKSKLHAKRMGDLRKLYKQFHLTEDTTPYAPLLRDILRLLLNGDSSGLTRGAVIDGTPLVSTTVHRMIFELLCEIPKQERYEEQAQQYGDYWRHHDNYVKKSSMLHEDEMCHIYLAQELARAFYTVPALGQTAQSILNHVCPKEEKDNDLFSTTLPKKSLAASLQHEREVIGKANEKLSITKVAPRKLGAKGGTAYFNPGAQQNIPERMWKESYHISNSKGTEIHETVQLRVGSPTKGEEVTGAFKLFLDSLYTTGERLCYVSLQKPKADEKPRVESLVQLAKKNPRYRKAIVVMNFPMDGSFYHRKDKKGQTYEEFKEEFLNLIAPKDAKEVDTREQGGFYVPLPQLKEWWEKTELPWNSFCLKNIDEAKEQYFPSLENDTTMTIQQQQALLLISYAKIRRALRPLFQIDFAIDGCKDDQDRGAVVKLIMALDNLMMKGRHKNQEDLLALRLAYHRAAWFNKSQAVLEHGRADVAEATVEFMMKALKNQKKLPDQVLLPSLQLNNMKFCEPTP